MNMRIAQITVPVPDLSGRIVFVTAIGALSVGTGLYLAYGALAHASPAPSSPQAYGGAPATADAPQPLQARELTIANNGLVFLRGAKVESASGSGFTVVIEWSSMSQTWSVHTSSATKYYDVDGHLLKAPVLRAGDGITVTGTIVPGAVGNSIDAQYVRT